MIKGSETRSFWYHKEPPCNVTSTMEPLYTATQLAAAREQGRKDCTWKQNEEGNWETSCGNLHILIEGIPAANDMKFCCYCGGAMKGD